MAVSDSLRVHLQQTAPDTSERLSGGAFLLSGAVMGVLGWGGTQVLTWLTLDAGALYATGFWALLLAGFVVLTVLHGPKSVRFSDVMFVWVAVNATAMALTLSGLAGLVPEHVAFWDGWVAAMAIGYCWTGGLLEGAGQPARGRGYLGAGLVGIGLLAVGVVAFDRIASVLFLPLGALHAVPLILDVRTALPAVHRTAVVGLAVAVALGAGAILA